MKGSVHGFTLLEVMLVLAISASIFILGYRMYISMRNDADLHQVQYNVDRLFGAASEYYQANCRMQINAQTGAQIGTNGTLDPNYSPVPATNYPVAVSSLTTSGYLDATLPKNRLIDSSTINNGYVVQFNQSAATNRTLNGNLMGKVIIWRIQVAVAIRSNAGGKVAKAIVRQLGADCASILSGGYVTPCASNPVVPNTGVIYAVWERLPSYAVPNAESNTWHTNAQTKSFNQLYTNNNLDNWQPNGGAGSDYQNYLCGS